MAPCKCTTRPRLIRCDHLFTWPNDLAGMSPDVMQHAAPHVRALVDGKTNVGNSRRLKANTSEEESVALVGWSFYYPVEARTTEQKLFYHHP